MHFTPTHILAIVPIAVVARLAVPLPALVIGGMIPDFPLFVPIGLEYCTTRSSAGIFTTCFHLGFAMVFLFQLVAYFVAVVVPVFVSSFLWRRHEL